VERPKKLHRGERIRTERGKKSPKNTSIEWRKGAVLSEEGGDFAKKPIHKKWRCIKKVGKGKGRLLKSPFFCKKKEGEDGCPDHLSEKN